MMQRISRLRSVEKALTAAGASYGLEHGAVLSIEVDMVGCSKYKKIEIGVDCRLQVRTDGVYLPTNQPGD